MCLSTTLSAPRTISSPRTLSSPWTRSLTSMCSPRTVSSPKKTRYSNQQQQRRSPTTSSSCHRLRQLQGAQTPPTGSYSRPECAALLVGLRCGCCAQRIVQCRTRRLHYALCVRGAVKRCDNFTAYSLTSTLAVSGLDKISVSLVHCVRHDHHIQFAHAFGHFPADRQQIRALSSPQLSSTSSKFSHGMGLSVGEQTKKQPYQVCCETLSKSGVISCEVSNKQFSGRGICLQRAFVNFNVKVIFGLPRS